MCSRSRGLCRVVDLVSGIIVGLGLRVSAIMVEVRARVVSILVFYSCLFFALGAIVLVLGLVSRL